MAVATRSSKVDSSSTVTVVVDVIETVKMTFKRVWGEGAREGEILMEDGDGVRIVGG